MINIQKMMQQAQQMQFKLQEMQEKFKDIDVEGDAGGGLVKITMSCAGVMKSLKMDPSLFTQDGQEMIEDLVIAAHNNVMEAKDARIKDETGRMMEDLGLPKDAKLPF